MQIRALEQRRLPLGLWSMTGSLSRTRCAHAAVALGLGFTSLAAACGGSNSANDAGVSTNSESGATNGDGTPALSETDLETLGATRPLNFTQPADTPPVDRTRAEVPLDQIIFDTFDGGGVALSDADQETITRLFDVIAPIDAPAYESAGAAGWLNDDDLIIGYVDPGGQAWAYPARILNSREIVNDELGGQAVLISYCPLCGSGVVYSREHAGAGDRTLSFSNTSALYENDMVMVDRETGTYWWQVAGSGLVGELSGSLLELLPSQTTSWSSWVEQYPDTAVMVRPAGRDFSGDPFSSYADTLDSGRTPFPVGDGVMEDDRLASSARVVVVTQDGETRAWAASPARSFEDQVGGLPVTVTLDGVGGTVVDSQGLPVPSRAAFWFSIVSVYPDIEIGP